MNKDAPMIEATVLPRVAVSPCLACSSVKKSRGAVPKWRLRPGFVHGPIKEKKTGLPCHAAASTLNGRFDSGHRPVHAARSSDSVSEFREGTTASNCAES